jgi:hypothetical protein
MVILGKVSIFKTLMQYESLSLCYLHLLFPLPLLNLLF